MARLSRPRRSPYQGAETVNASFTVEAVDYEMTAVSEELSTGWSSHSMMMTVLR